MVIAEAVAVGAVAAVAAPAVLTAAGFAATGVVPGSVAAGVQSMIGNVAAGSVFSVLQSVGATGVALGTKAAIGTTIGGIKIVSWIFGY